jgi:hypothetical protein
MEKSNSNPSNTSNLEGVVNKLRQLSSEYGQFVEDNESLSSVSDDDIDDLYDAVDYVNEKQSSDQIEVDDDMPIDDDETTEEIIEIGSSEHLLSNKINLLLPTRTQVMNGSIVLATGTFLSVCIYYGTRFILNKFEK